MLKPFKPILFWKIFNFFHFILGSQFLLPQRANNGKEVPFSRQCKGSVTFRVQLALLVVVGSAPLIVRMKAR